MSRGINPRPAVAYRHAEPAELERVRYVQTGGAWDGFPNLGRAASRVLAFFAALHRSGEVGFVGTRAPAATVAAAIERATKIPLAERTYWRAIGELAAAGLVERSTWGGGRPTEGRGGWYRRPVSVVTLTDRATSIWSKSRAGSRRRQVSDNHTPLPKWQADGSYESPGLPVGSPRGTLCACTIEVGRHPAPILTSAVSPSATRLTGSHSLAVSVPAGSFVAAPRPAARKGATQIAGQSGLAVSSGTAAPPRPSGGVATPRPELTAGPDPRRAPGASTWRTGARGWLAVLELLLAQSGRHTREGAAAVARARRELDPHFDPGPDASGIDWSHWVWQWGRLNRSERWGIARRELAPRLLGHELAASRRVAGSPTSASSRRPGATGESPAQTSSSPPDLTRDDLPGVSLGDALAAMPDIAEQLAALGVNLGRGAPQNRRDDE